MQADDGCVCMALQLFFRGSNLTTHTRVNTPQIYFQLPLFRSTSFLSHLSSDLLTVDLCMTQALCYSLLKFLAPSLFLPLSLCQVLLAICWSVKLTDNAHEWWMMTGGLSGANRMHNTACRQRFLPFALNTCCSYCIISVEDLPTADNCDSLKWKPPSAASRYVCTYCVNLQFLVRGVLKECEARMFDCNVKNKQTST